MRVGWARPCHNSLHVSYTHNHTASIPTAIARTVNPLGPEPLASQTVPCCQLPGVALSSPLHAAKPSQSLMVWTSKAHVRADSLCVSYLEPYTSSPSIGKAIVSYVVGRQKLTYKDGRDYPLWVRYLEPNGSSPSGGH